MASHTISSHVPLPQRFLQGLPPGRGGSPGGGLFPGSPGQGENAQSGPWRPTVEPSGQTFASFVHACIGGAGSAPGGPGGALPGGASGQGANSHFGPLRPTAEPSGQTFASIVQGRSPPASGGGGEGDDVDAQATTRVASVARAAPAASVEIVFIVGTT
jgi:hypothetical protein